jgi:hypothetical protein
VGEDSFNDKFTIKSTSISVVFKTPGIAVQGDFYHCTGAAKKASILINAFEKRILPIAMTFAWIKNILMGYGCSS